MTLNVDMIAEKARIARNLTAAYFQVLRYPTVKKAKSHSLPGRLVVSLTSYAARFGTLHLTLKSILDQETKPDRVELWLGYGDKEHVPENVARLQSDGLDIHYTQDIRSYTKIIPALIKDPEAFIITVDDDCYYPRDLVKVLTSEFNPDRPSINCRRANIITRNADGSMRPYREWIGNPDENTPAEHPQSDVFATGHGGVLYYPGCFDPEVLNESVFRKICPHADDVWLYWMARKAGTLYRKVGGKFVSTNWRGSQADSLMATNVLQSKNDQQIAQMAEFYGLV